MTGLKPVVGYSCMHPVVPDDDIRSSEVITEKPATESIPQQHIGAATKLYYLLCRYSNSRWQCFSALIK